MSAEGWSAAAAGYSEKLVQATSDGGEGLLQLVESVRPFSEDAVVLDSGCGSGALTSLLRGRSAAMSLTAGDLAPGMLEQFAKRNLSNVSTLVLDATGDYVGQGLQADHFTHVVSSFMLQFINPVQAAIDQTYRVLQPGGLIGSAIWSHNDIAEPWNMACKNLDPTFQPAESPFSKDLRSTQDLEALYAASGFVDCRSSETDVYLIFESAEAWTDFFFNSPNPPFLLMQKAWKGNKEDVREEMIKVTREQFENGRIYMRAACTVGVKPKN